MAKERDLARVQSRKGPNLGIELPDAQLFTLLGDRALELVVGLEGLQVDAGGFGGRPERTVSCVEPNRGVGLHLAAKAVPRAVERGAEGRRANERGDERTVWHD